MADIHVMYPEGGVHEGFIEIAEPIVGERWRVEDISSGVGKTFKIEGDGDYWGDHKRGYREPIEIPFPVAGLIWRIKSTLNKSRPWHAECQRCSDVSKDYTKKNEPALWHWAHAHRCQRRKGGYDYDRRR